MRIVMLSHGYPPTVSGVSLVVQKISRALVQRGHNVTVITASERGKACSAEDQGVRLLRIRSWRNPFWSEGPLPTIRLDELRSILDHAEPDIIHTHENVVLSTQLLRLRRELKVPLISSCYFLPRYITHYLRPGSLIERGIETAVWKYIVRNLNRYDHVVFSTRSQAQDYIDHGLRAATTVISNGVDTTRYLPRNGAREDLTGRFQLPPHPRILFVSRLMKDKKIDVLIRAMAQICAGRPAHLVIAGRGDEQPRLDALTRELGLERNVHFLGFVPEADLPALYRSCDLFTIASICEVQSIPTLQALVTGLPVVAAGAGALPELVQEGVNGFLVPPGHPDALAQAILRILSTPDYARRLGQAGLAIGRPHAETATFQAYENLYRRLIAAWPAGKETPEVLSG